MYFYIEQHNGSMESAVKYLLAAIVAVMTFVPSSTTYACADTFYRVGMNISYRVYTAPLPGNVLVYGESDGARQLAEALAQSGHGVHLVENETDLAQEMGKGGYDVVIASYSEQAVIEANKKDSRTEFIPVVVSKEEEKAAKRTYQRVLMAEQAEVKHYLKAIHKSLKSRA